MPPTIRLVTESGTRAAGAHGACRRTGASLAFVTRALRRVGRHPLSVRSTTV
ncbi:hypothetical protein trd_1650 [Thermomicrobium roseum DSM 5159]|uniref:Uncharacterized protein n=1 Tax=Thermomicrobium roseum (strain ATCC 27502 / DSM 5159 / P-2) TaxID=309801 RepID=B9L0F7_THERP|nr:hypothetical protein trd_1650 [Thermomicrobium roseum DSM 5159]